MFFFEMLPEYAKSPRILERDRSDNWDGLLSAPNGPTATSVPYITKSHLSNSASKNYFIFVNIKKITIPSIIINFQ